MTILCIVNNFQPQKPGTCNFVHNITTSYKLGDPKYLQSALKLFPAVRNMNNLGSRTVLWNKGYYFTTLEPKRSHKIK